MRKKLHIALVGILCTSFVAVSSNVAPVRAALNYPSAQALWTECGGNASAEFCVESFEFTPANGSKQVIANPAPDYMNNGAAIIGRTDPYIGVFLSSAYTGPSSVNSMMPTAVSINYYDPVGSVFDPATLPRTLDGLVDGLYHVVIRTGDYDPSVMMLTGKYESFTVTKGADGYFTVDLSIRPTPIARVVAFDNDQTTINTCKTNKWLSNCEANLAFKQWALVSFAMLPEEALRNAVRGTWISTNASVLNLSPAGLLQGNLDVDAQGPHYVPTDFPTTGLTAEGNRYLNPAYFEMYVPYEMVAYVMGQKLGKTITVDQVKTYLANPTDVLEGTVEEAASAASAVVEKAATLGVQKSDTGVRVNFNLTHFSAPNPTLKIKTPTSATTGTTTTKVAKKLGNGATITPSTSAKKGQTISGKNLVKPSSGAKVSKVATKTKAICSVKGTSVKMLKVGTCRLSVSVLYKKKTSAASVAIVVS